MSETKERSALEVLRQRVIDEGCAWMGDDGQPCARQRIGPDDWCMACLADAALQSLRATPASDGGDLRERVAGIIEDALFAGWNGDAELVEMIGDFTDRIFALLSGTPPGEGEAPANERAMAILAFLNGEGEIDGRWFHERPEGKGAFWWRRYLPELRAALRSAPAGEGEAGTLPRCLNGYAHTWEWTDTGEGDEEVRCVDCKMIARLRSEGGGE